MRVEVLRLIWVAEVAESENCGSCLLLKDANAAVRASLYCGTMLTLDLALGLRAFGDHHWPYGLLEQE